MAGAAHYVEALYRSWSPVSKKEWGEIMRDFKKFVSHHIIINKQGEAVKMKMNPAQEKVAELILKYSLAKEPRPVKLVIHKSRQMGISTILTLIEKYIASRVTKINILHMLPDEKLARDYWKEKGEPLWQGSDPAILPKASVTTTPTPYISVRDFVGTNMQVNIRYNGSNSKAAMRSSTNHVIILDEYAFFENVKRLEKGVLASQPKTGLAITVYVSTANGMNHFYDVVKQAVEPNSGIEHIFLPWHMLDEYEKPISKESRLYDLDKYEPTAYDMKLFDIFEKEGYPKEKWLNKIEWYDYVTSTEAKGDTDYMKSEYPSCVVAGTRVGTADGIIPIEEAYDGIEATLGEVSQTHRQPMSPVAKLTTAKGFELIGTYDHPIKTTDGFVDLIDSVGHTAMLLRPKTAVKPYTVEWRELGTTRSITATEDLAEWLGYWMGDGSYSGNTLEFALCKRDDDVVERMHNLTESIFGLTMYGRTSGSNGGGYNLRVGSKDLKTVMEKLGLSRTRKDGSLGKNLRVPEIIWRSPLNIQRAFLRGLFEADGFIGKSGKSNGYVKLFTKSSDFAKDVQLLLLANGIVSKRRLRIKREKTGKEYPGTELYLGSVATDKFREIGFISKFKKDRLNSNHAPGPNAKPMVFEDEIISVEPMGEDYTYNLTVPGPDTFDANGIWTHNTPEESFEASGRPVLPLKVINYWLKQEHPYTPISPVAKSNGVMSRMKVSFEKDPNSPVRKYLDPQAGHHYMIAVDCAEGYAGDLSAGVMIDVKTMEEVCSFVVDYEQNDLAELVVDLAKYYNNAKIVPEKNMAGLFIESVQMLGYWNMYIDPDYRGPSSNKMFGVRTTVSTKNEAINRLKFLMNNNIYKAHDKVFMEQAVHYSWKQLPSGGSKAEAVGQDDDGNPWHDDAVACRLALMMAIDFRQYKNYLRKGTNGKRS